MASKSLYVLDACEPNQKVLEGSVTQELHKETTESCLCSGPSQWFRIGRRVGPRTGQVTYSGGFLFCHQERRISKSRQWVGSSRRPGPCAHCLETGWVSPKRWGSPRPKVWGRHQCLCPPPTDSRTWSPNSRAQRGNQPFCSLLERHYLQLRMVNCLFKKDCSRAIFRAPVFPQPAAQ